MSFLRLSCSGHGATCQLSHLPPDKRFQVEKSSLQRRVINVLLRAKKFSTKKFYNCAFVFIDLLWRDRQLIAFINSTSQMVYSFLFYAAWEGKMNAVVNWNQWHWQCQIVWKPYSGKCPLLLGSGGQCKQRPLPRVDTQPSHLQEQPNKILTNRRMFWKEWPWRKGIDKHISSPVMAMPEKEADHMLFSKSGGKTYSLLTKIRSGLDPSKRCSKQICKFFKLVCFKFFMENFFQWCNTVELDVLELRRNNPVGRRTWRVRSY